MKLLLCLLLRIGLRHGIRLKWQKPATNATRHLANLVTQPSIAKDAADAASYQTAKGSTKQSTQQALRCKLLPAVATQLRNPIHVVSCMLIENSVINEAHAASSYLCRLGRAWQMKRRFT